MAKIKIISNPYIKKIFYFNWQEDIQTWIPIDYSNNPNSMLVREKYKDGFFILIADQVLEAITNEYYDTHTAIELIFEGTDDEFNTLSELCAADNYTGKVHLSKSDIYLENARDILPVINRVFKEDISPLVSSSVRDRSRIDKDLARFSEAANDIVPVCVMGNYSTGKSTFINALIGCEILPAGDVPVTAKIYRIERSAYDDRAYIRFEYFGEPEELRFSRDTWMLVPELEDGTLADMLEKRLSDPELRTMIDRVRCSLDGINFIENSTPDVQEISDLIRMEVPFGAASCGYTGGDFVVFDTPGSNSASNFNHAEVLRSAMENMTNGLPLFVTEYDKLDSTDNEVLYNQLLDMEELDSAYTAIVVNKADCASLPKKGFKEEDVEQLLHLAVPRQLYSDGIFFVSSVMGLGAKNDGEFYDEHCAEIFEDQAHKYSKPESRFYKQLYHYNVQPEPAASEARAAAENCSDLVFANSGLFAVEHEIRNFAVHFSPYNKCTQACRFLGKVITVTDEELVNQREQHKIEKQQLEDKLSEDKLALIRQVESESRQLQETFIADYPAYMDTPVAEEKAGCQIETLRAWQQDIVAKQREVQQMDTQVDELRQSRDAMGNNLKTNFRSMVKNRKFADLKALGSSLIDDAKTTMSQTSNLIDTRRGVERAAAEELIEMAKADFNSRVAATQEHLEAISRSCWEQHGQELKDQLRAIVTGAEVLTEQRREELAEIIISYANIAFEPAGDRIFAVENFKKRFSLKNFFTGNGDVLNIENLQRSYNEELDTAVDQIRESIEKSHVYSFCFWQESLTETINKNIVNYSPELSRLSASIEGHSREIKDLEERKRRLAEYSQTIQNMMEWKQAR